MPVYNGERFLEEALRSILAQTFTDFELIVSDNASTDQTVKIVEVVAAGDPRVILKRNAANVGAAPNYNVLVELSRGKYFKWAAHDDNLHPTYLEQCLQGLQEHPEAVLCYPTTVMIDEQGALTGEDPYDPRDVTGTRPHERFRKYLKDAWPRCGCNAVFGLIRMEALMSTRLIGSYASSDKILLGELSMLGSFHQLSDSLFYRREHRGSSVRANPDVNARNRWFSATTDAGSGFIYWRWVREYLAGIRHTQIATLEKVLCTWELRDFLVRQWPRLFAELKRPIKRALGRTGVRTGNKP